MEAGKRRLADDTARAATSGEVQERSAEFATLGEIAEDFVAPAG